LFGNSYYRLQQTDLDGNSSYSAVVSIYIAKPEDQIAIGPNPNNGLFDVRVVTAYIGECNLIVHDPLGRVLM
jgi:hypothetical protein